VAYYIKIFFRSSLQNAVVKGLLESVHICRSHPLHGCFILTDSVVVVCVCNCQEGRSALHYAAIGGHTDVVRLLLTAGCDVNTRDKVGI